MSGSLQPHGLQHARLPCPSPTPRVCSNSYTLSQWCYPTISFSVIPFSSCLQSFPASGSFPMSQFFAQGGQSIGVSASVLPINYSGLISFRVDWLDLLAVRGTPKSLLQHHSSKVSILWCSALFYLLFFNHLSFLYYYFLLYNIVLVLPYINMNPPQLSHPYMTTGKTIALSRRTFVGKVMSLLSNILSRFVIVFLPRSKHLLISWLQSPSAVILEANKVCYCFHCFPIYLPWSDGTGCHDLSFLNVEI